MHTPVVIGSIISILFLGLYVFTLAPGLLWGGGDFATFQTLAYQGKIEIGTGIFAHPLWIILVQPFMKIPINDPAWRANFATAIFAALALYFVFLSAWQVTGSFPACILSVCALGISHTFWTYAVMPKVYSLNALLLSLCTYFLLRWRSTNLQRFLYIALLIYGLSFLNHIVMVIIFLGVLFFVIWNMRNIQQGRKRYYVSLAALLFFALGIAPYIVVTTLAGTALSIGEVISNYFSGLLFPFTHIEAMLKAVGLGVLLGVYQFPIAWIVGIVGLIRMKTKDIGLFGYVLLSLIGTAFFLLAATDPEAGGVYIWNLHYYLLIYVICALPIAVGIKWLWTSPYLNHWTRKLVFTSLVLCTPIIIYGLAPKIAPLVLKSVPDFRPLPGRNNFEYVLSPWKNNENGAREYGQNMLNSIPTGGILFADYSIWSVLNYLQVVDGQRPDVQLVELHGLADQLAEIKKYPATSLLFLADTYRYYAVDMIKTKFDIIPYGSIYKLVPK